MWISWVVGKFQAGPQFFTLTPLGAAIRVGSAMCPLILSLDARKTRRKSMKIINNYSSAMAAMGAVALVFWGIGGGLFYIGISKESYPTWFIGIVIFVLGAFPMIFKYLHLKSRDLSIIDGKIVYKSGIIEITEIELNIKAINGVIIRRSLFHRIFGGGEIGIACQGISSPVVVSASDINKLTINDVKNFYEIASAIKNGI